MKIGGGQYYKSMQARQNTYSAQLNRRAVETHRAAIQHYGNRLFSIGISHAQQSVELTFERVYKTFQADFQAQVQARLASLDGLGSSLGENASVDRTV